MLAAARALSSGVVISQAARRSIRQGLLRTPLPVRRRVEVGLLRTYEAYTRLRSRHEDEGPPSAGGYPVPPAKLRILVSSTPDPEFFLDTGRRQADLFRSMLERNGGALEDAGAILDFGCGCGRVTRWWAGLEGPAIFGCDPNRELIAWTRANLPFINAAVSEENPPLPYPDATFGFVCALSIFTHLPERQALDWMAELRRVIRPGGHLLFTTAGEAYRDRLTADEAARYDRGEEVVQFDTARGTNLCIAYHSPSFVRERMLAGYEEVEAFLTPEHPEESAAARMPQDCYLVRAAPR